MKKSVKKALIATFATVFVGATATTIACGKAEMMSASAAGTAVTDFVMLADPTIRATNAADGSGNGIRFTAEIDKTQFEALDGTVTAGTFIMPYSYVSTYAKDTTLTKENFFGDSACFVWGDGATASATKAKILHVAATPYAATNDAGEDVYKINGSVVNMLNKNLEREYIGVSYIAVENGGSTEYYLANTDAELASKSTLQVAQDVLLADSEAIEDSVATGYLQTYIDWYKDTNDGAAPTRTLTTEYYIDSSEGYSKSKKFGATQEITMDEVADFTTAQIGEETPTLDGYTYAVGANGNVTSTVLSADNGGTVKYYFDKNRNNVIFDGATMTVAPLTGSDHTAVEADVVLKNTSAANPDIGNPGMVASGEWGLHGENSIMLRTPGGIQDWMYMYFNNQVAKSFPATSKFAFTVRTGATRADETITLYFKPYGSNEFKSENGLIRSGAEGEVKTVVVDCGKAITSLEYLAFYTQATEAYWIDYIRPYYELTSSLGNLEIAKEQTTVDVDVVGGLTSTVYSDEELATAQITATYTTLSTGATQNLTLTGGKATLTVAENTDYQVNYTATIDGKKASGSLYVFGYYEKMIADFDSHGANWTEKVMNSAGTYGYVYDKDGTVKAGVGMDGGNAYYIQEYATNWAGVYTDKTITLSAGANTLCMYIYCPSEGDRTYAPSGTFIEFFNGSSWPSGTLASTTLKYGWNYIETTVNNSTGSDYVCNNFIIKTNAALMGCYIDRIALK